jgi:hypothetical protein
MLEIQTSSAIRNWQSETGKQALANLKKMFGAEPFTSISIEDLTEYVQYQLEDMHFVYHDKVVCYNFQALSYNYPLIAVEDEIRFVQI